ncbi:hypothetical protein D3OALGA1CA_5140 [Olavius algarvensis associated proteobacterium Delta 3]|nr:hypothetical protein D3OALGB2SA_3036 [Olavius algarvensis associated proteobacterium Delta 3]CAB5162436.1 hypothetical protein D3OALGA1CA_5140 [Olavius algarvensis associated proteobacterium Delta 3]
MTGIQKLGSEERKSGNHWDGVLRRFLEKICHRKILICQIDNFDE